MTITFLDKTCAVTRTSKVYFLLKRQFKNKRKRMKDICYNIVIS